MTINDEKIISEGPVYSFHAFLFPFEWKYTGKADQLFEEQVCLQDLIGWMQRDKVWERRTSWLKVQSLAQFNEVAYFYDFVRPVLYDSGNNESTLQAHYYYQLPEGDCEYVIELPNGTTYHLEIDDITISYFDMGIGILAFHLLNKDAAQSSPQDILNINFFGRRVYPPFLSTDINQVGQQAFFTNDDWVFGLHRTVNASGELARSISLECDGGPWVLDNFSSWTVDQNLRRAPDLIEQLLPVPLKNKVTIQPVLDDRMYVISWYGNDQLATQLKGTDADQHFQKEEWWYRYIFIDKEWATCSNGQMMADLLQKATYQRWTGQGTFYGISRYSFMVLMDEMASGFFPKLVFTHTQTLYFKLVMLCIVQRACLLRFSEEITAISQLNVKKGKIGARIGSLYQQYLRFVNKIYFREVTAQEQGIELYQKLHQQMELPQQVTALQLEMQELHQYALIIEEDQRNDKLDMLTYIGAFFVVPSFIGTYFGIADYDLSEHWQWISVFCVASAGLAYGAIRTTGRQRLWWLAVLILLMLLVIFVFPNLEIWDKNG